MKLTIRTAPFARCCAAVFRKSLSDEGAQRHCPVHKCRRDGRCAGPLVGNGDDAQRLVRADAADVVSRELPVPVCFFHVTNPMRDRVEQAYAARLRALVYEPGADVVEATRAISARPWRRLRGLQ
jgi:hypothetical protein